MSFCLSCCPHSELSLAEAAVSTDHVNGATRWRLAIFGSFGEKTDLSSCSVAYHIYVALYFLWQHIG